MKEFLNKKPDGSYELIVSNGGCVDGDWIEVPNGMNYAYGAGSFIQFTKQEMGYRDSVLVWQRESQAKPLVDWGNVIDNAQQIFDHENAGEPSLNDQYAEIEQVRQAIKVPDGSDSNHALDAMSFGLMGAGAAQSAKDNVDHPSHYTQGKVECIDALESATIGKSGIEAVCVANVIKYLWRYEEKNGLEDVKKAQWYLERLIASMES